MKPIIPASRRLINLIIVAALVASACNLFQPSSTTPVPEPIQISKITPEQPELPEQPTLVPESLPTPTTIPATVQDPALTFATYVLPEVQSIPSAAGLDVPPEWKQVRNSFILSDEQVQRIQANGFVVTPGTEKEFFTVYEKARYANVPIFVTSDSLLHSYHLLFDKILRTAEVKHFIPLLRDLNQAILKRADEVYQELRGTAWEADALRTVAFLGVGSVLLDPTVIVPDYTQALVQSELDLVNSGSGMLPSPLFPSLKFGEDYTQYIPRGHYTRSEELKAYFRSMMWYGRMTFLLKEKADTRAAILLTHIVRTSQVDGNPAVDAWKDLYSPTVFFVGRSDDLTIFQYGDLMNEVYGPDASLTTLADDSRLESFMVLAKELPPPRILGIVISVDDDVDDSTKGMRFMGQRFVPDAYIFRQLIFRNVGTLDNRRGLPMGLDLFAAMGSDRAYEILDSLGETQYANYPEQMTKVQTWLMSLSLAEWTETLYNSWLFTFYPLIEEPKTGSPYFMLNDAWKDKQLNSALGSWAELKHDTILYAKQVYAELGGGPPAPEPIPPQGYVEPVPDFFARLGALTSMTLSGLDQRGLLNDVDRASLTRLEQDSYTLQAIAEKELRGEPLTEEEFHFIRFIGGELEYFVMASADTENEDPFAPKYMDEEPQAAVIADVATDPQHEELGHVVLEEGVGRIQYIHVMVPVVQPDDSLLWQISRGGTFSYYEFPWPADDRLTDEKWRNMLDDGSAPDLPSWTSSFFVEQGEYEQLRQGVASFQSGETDAFWYIDSDMSEYNLAAIIFAQDLAELRANHQFEGRQFASANFLSYEMQSDTQAVVTREEVWQGKLYPGDYPEFLDPIAERGPYTRIATYTLTYSPDESRWVVTAAIFQGEIPEWVSK